MAAFTLSEVKVGMMVVLALALLFALTVAVGNFQHLISDTVVVSIMVPSVVGLDPYAQVTYSGVRIGTVVGIEYDMSRDMAKVSAKIERNSPVALDSIVRFTSESLLSPLFLDISGGTREKRIAPLLDSGKIKPEDIELSAMPYASIGDFFALAGDVKAIAAKVEVLLTDLQDPILKVGGFIDNVSQEMEIILGEVEGTVTEARPYMVGMMNYSSLLVQDVSRSIVPTLNNIRRGSEDVPLMMQDARKGVNEVMSKASGLIDAVSPEITQTAQEVRLILEDLRGRMQRLEDSLVKMLNDTDSILVDNREEIENTIRHLQRAMANLDDVSQQLAKDPWRLLWKTDERKTPPRVSPAWEPFAPRSSAAGKN